MVTSKPKRMSAKVGVAQAMVYLLDCGWMERNRYRLQTYIVTSKPRRMSAKVGVCQVIVISPLFVLGSGALWPCLAACPCFCRPRASLWTKSMVESKVLIYRRILTSLRSLPGADSKVRVGSTGCWHARWLAVGSQVWGARAPRRCRRADRRLPTGDRRRSASSRPNRGVPAPTGDQATSTSVSPRAGHESGGCDRVDWNL